MERTYQTKSDALLERERHSIERLQKQTEVSCASDIFHYSRYVYNCSSYHCVLIIQMQERETYSQRQSTLAEIEAVRSREADLKRQADLHSRYSHLK